MWNNNSLECQWLTKHKTRQTNTSKRQDKQQNQIKTTKIVYDENSMSIYVFIKKTFLRN